MIISPVFFGFILLGVVIYWLIPVQRLRNLFLTLISFAFIYMFDKSALVIVIVLTLISYLMAFLIEKFKKNRFVFVISIVFLLLTLVIFKYSGMIASTYNAFAGFIKGFPEVRISTLLIPLGLSFITFKLISYLTDIHWGLTKKGNIIELFTYTSLFTIFIAGPIERFEKFNPQISKTINFNALFVSEGFERIVIGLSKKVILADWIGYFIQPIWSNQEQYSVLIKMLALLGYSIQIYLDFSGYSDIAIGSSRLFGFKIMENFNNPYFQSNISQFWRCWHISLSDWIRDYVFFPLSKFSDKRIYNMLFVPIIAMALCGLWHGGAWHFALWGIWHGAGIATLQYWNAYKRKHKKLALISKKTWFNYTSIALTFIFVTAGWLWFM